MTDRYEKIRKAIAMGPTPGPWLFCPTNSGTFVKSERLAGYFVEVRRCRTKQDVDADAHLVAACDPDTIRALLDERDALAADVERLQKEACEWQVSALHGEEIHVNVEGGDVYMLPLQPSGMESPRFVVHVPAVSHLEWSQTLLDGETVTLSQAEEAVAKLGEGWRLPTRQELESLLDLSRHDPAIDTSRYPDAKSCAYWTGTPCAWNSDARWVVDFGGGFVDDYDRNDYACVRAVRDVEEGIESLPLHTQPQPAVPEADELRSALSDVVSVAITMLYDSHKPDVVEEFTVDELKDVVERTKHLQDARVEDVYRAGYRLLTTPTPATTPQVDGWVSMADREPTKSDEMSAGSGVPNHE